MFTKHKIGCFVILLLVLDVYYCQRSKLNTECKIRTTGAKGTCLLPINCPRVQKDAERGIQPTRCGQNAPNQEIVCCQGAYPVFNTPPSPNDNSLLNVPDGIAYPETTGEASGVDETAEGYKASQRCREYLPVQQISFTSLALDNVATTVNVTKCYKNGVPLIVGGQDADPGEFPFMVAIGWPDGDQIDFSCGGTLISNQYVLTAAHCTFRRNSGSPTVVRIGATNLRATDQGHERNAENYRISDIKTHEDYTGITHYNDIALIKLHRKIPQWTNYIRPVCLWTRSSFDSTNAIVTGWGHIEEAGEPSDVLQKVTLQLFSKDICQNRYKNMKKLPQGIPDSMICSGYLAGGRDTCQGDSGGPLLTKKIDGSCEYYLIGITSFGIGCAQAQTPGLYTKVSSYMGWIEKNVWN